MTSTRTWKAENISSSGKSIQKDAQSKYNKQQTITSSEYNLN